MDQLSIAKGMSEDKQSKILTTITSYGKGLLSFIRKRVKSDADAEDILQDVWFQLTAVINSEPVEQVGGWLYRVARNRIIDKYRKKTETSYDDTMEDDNEQSVSFSELLLGVNDSPEKTYQDRLMWKTLFSSLEELPAAQRDVFVWHELDHIPFAEIAERTGESVNTLISRKRYAVLHLRKRLLVFYKELDK
ncbi:MULTISPECIES: RNA polymerase sigma factor [Olivibacter]|jgi:RNA polymerase sigma factor (sigma-70 family)|uniref:RNA polymerase, sigma-24 subunit, ECF subfamily n=3 Tax=Sphingobacteriaceae TaxID=84566 RepID=F4C7E9_SPHS2|nr:MULTISPECIES: sigma-70 family RNA polymerase sigma factor [Olivibacter]MCL4641684.1 sigma-70 family RNA polymerase sigma factor [Olivibacter sp. UJ_SKK_5.1]MDM8175767.1 sigma-70 family RNA polymerase sigma factor [Olivibacter sp. 47]MDX3914375.1 sigma-70 family RNA polymerase sigma factor [Pseudosphingobacterium sp.]